MSGVGKTIMYKPLDVFNRLWRLIITGLLFVLFGIGGWLLSTCWFSFLNLLVKDQQKRNHITQNSIRCSFKLFLNLASMLRALDYKVINQQLLQGDYGCIVIANHPSLLDYVLLASIMPRCDCIVKQALLNNFFMKGVIKAAGYIANDDSEQLLAACQKRLDQQGMILIFPEGTRTTYGKRIQLQRGAAQIALRCQANIRIIHISCNEVLLTKQKKWYHVPPRKPMFTIKVAEKITTKEFIEADDISLAIGARRLTNYLSDLLETTNTEN